MYFDFVVKIPKIKGKIFERTIKGVVYINYEYERVYKPEKKYNIPKRTTIGKRAEDDSRMMFPNTNYLKFFPEEELPGFAERTDRSSCLRIGAFLIIRKIICEYGLDGMISRIIGRDAGLFLDLAAYSITCENNAGQYYPDYAFGHPLFTDGMKVYSDAKVSDFLSTMSVNKSISFLNEWNASRDHRERIYISYDSTNKSCQAGDIGIAEYGHSKDGQDKPVFNYSIAYDTGNREPLFYEEYPGSIVDVSQLQYMLEKAKGYGYKKVGFILDRGYFSKENIHYMDRCGYDFVIMARGMKQFVSELILENKGSFEESRSSSIREYKANGITVKRKLFPADEEDRYFHIYYSSQKHASEREAVEAKIDQMARYLKKQEGVAHPPLDGFDRYFDLIYYHQGQEDEKFMFGKEKTDVIDHEISLCGYFVIITSKKMTAREALALYKSRDGSEKLFRGDKSYLGNKSLRVQSDESAGAKIFIEFVALIIRNRIYTNLRDEMRELDQKMNFMTVPAALKELEKIEMIRQLDGRYRLDHAVTKTQKTILKAFGIDAAYVKDRAGKISEELSGLL
ncbi:MAG: transposase [Clostridiales Family XIII bacterium]|jgi:transposase|nr:transposase [Clostridiales Family XIII bacterium]